MNDKSKNILRIFIEALELKRYSPSTIKVYKSALLEYFKFFNDFDLKDISYENNMNYFKKLYNEKKYSVSKMKQIISAVKFLDENLFKKTREVYYFEDTHKLEQLAFEKQKKDKSISHKDIIKFFRVIVNLKHKAIMGTIYSAGLRISEVINLKITDINSDRMVIFIRNSKGNKDRYSILSSKLLYILRMYYKEYKPKVWLFEGIAGRQYSVASVQNIFHHALKKAGIKNIYSVHSLRHSFATHLLENGESINTIRELLGHSNFKTTEIYTNIDNQALSNIKSPLDKAIKE